MDIPQELIRITREVNDGYKELARELARLDTQLQLNSQRERNLRRDLMLVAGGASATFTGVIHLGLHYFGLL